MPRRLALAHALSTGQPNFPIQIHGENPPALPVARKGKGGRLLRRPQQAHSAATVADFRAAVLTCGRPSKIRSCNHQRTLLYLRASRNYKNLRQNRCPREGHPRHQQSPCKHAQPFEPIDSLLSPTEYEVV
jgi:hypothetical protein